jgi:hypothetical protein
VRKAGKGKRLQVRATFVLDNTIAHDDMMTKGPVSASILYDRRGYVKTPERECIYAHLVHVDIQEVRR